MIGLMIAAGAYFVTGNELEADCSRKLPNCMAYIVGVADGEGLIESANRTQVICLPDGATRGQIRDVAVKYLEDHPERRHQNAGWLVIDALQKAFACPPIKRP